MGKRITLSDNDLEILELLLMWRINAENPTNNGNAIIGKYRCQELLDKLALNQPSNKAKGES